MQIQAVSSRTSAPIDSRQSWSLGPTRMPTGATVPRTFNVPAFLSLVEAIDEQKMNHVRKDVLMPIKNAILARRVAESVGTIVICRGTSPSNPHTVTQTRVMRRSTRLWNHASRVAAG